MVNTYQKDANRLMYNIVKEQNVGGFMIQDFGSSKEMLFALKHDGRKFTKVVTMPNTEFGVNGWTEVEEIPANAEWIGQYKINA